mmetsp:Transcript_25952/g.59993  ORF Transcript_25952/g.59993 Transcript_25952/m.59993 type:complete len:689 (+) Transcript_25952:51-2117(+)
MASSPSSQSRWPKAPAGQGDLIGLRSPGRTSKPPSVGHTAELWSSTEARNSQSKWLAESLQERPSDVPWASSVSCLESRVKVLESQGGRCDRRVAELAGLAQALSEEQRVLLVRVDKLEETRGIVGTTYATGASDGTEDHARRLARLEREQRTVAVNLRLVVSVAEEAQQRQQQRLRALQDALEGRLRVLEEVISTFSEGHLTELHKSQSLDRSGIADELRGVGVSSSLGAAGKRLEEAQQLLRHGTTSSHEVGDTGQAPLLRTPLMEDIQSEMQAVSARLHGVEEQMANLQCDVLEVKCKPIAKVAEEEMAKLREEVAEAKDVADAAITLRRHSAEVDASKIEKLMGLLKEAKAVADAALARTEELAVAPATQLADMDTKISQVKAIADDAFSRSQLFEVNDVHDIKQQLQEAKRDLNLSKRMSAEAKKLAEVAMSRTESQSEMTPTEAVETGRLSSACSGDLAAGAADFEARTEALHMPLANSAHRRSPRKGRRSTAEDAITEYRAQAHAIEADLEVRLSKLNTQMRDEAAAPEQQHTSMEAASIEEDVRSWCAQLEEELSADIKEAHRRCDTIQEAVGQQIMVSVWRLEKELPSAVSKVDRLVGECHERFAKVEEHDVRLNYALGKLGACEQRLQTCVERIERVPNGQQVRMICREESNRAREALHLAQLERPHMADGGAKDWDA